MQTHTECCALCVTRAARHDAEDGGGAGWRGQSLYAAVHSGADCHVSQHAARTGDTVCVEIPVVMSCHVMSPNTLSEQVTLCVCRDHSCCHVMSLNMQHVARTGDTDYRCRDHSCCHVMSVYICRDSCCHVMSVYICRDSCCHVMSPNMLSEQVTLSVCIEILVVMSCLPT